MNADQREKLERLLSEGAIPEPPAGLLEKIKTEIPAELPRVTPRLEPARPRWHWQLAASLFLLIGFGFAVYRFGLVRGYDYGRETGEEVAQRQTVATSPQPSEATVPKAPTKTERASESTPTPTLVRADERKMRSADAAASEVAVMEPVPTREEPQGAERGIVGGVVGGVADQVVVTPEVPQMRKLAAARAEPSTGGTAPPNAQPYGDVFFQNSGVNPFIDTEEDPVSTFGLDVDTASYTIARRYLNDGHLPPPEAVRPEEFLNYFDYGDPPPSRADFAIYAEGGGSPFPRGARYAMIRFGIRARTLSTGSRAPAVLTFVVDTSGSMERENRLQLVKQTLNLLLDELREDDEVGLVAFSDQAELLLEPTGDHQAIRRAIARLEPRGSTNAAAGLRLGYETATASFRRGANNRVILCSDGVANVGLTSAEAILRDVERMKDRGVMLTTVGVGMGNFNDVLLEQLADRGNGTYAYVDDLEEGRRVFVENLTGTLQTIAEDARVQVQFNPRAVARYRLIGYENRAIADDRFRDDATDAGEIGSGHSVTVLYEIKLQPEPRGGEELATLTLRYRPSEASRFREIERAIRLSELAPDWESAAPGYRLATLVASFAETLKDLDWARHIDRHDLADKAQMLGSRSRSDEKVREFTALTRRAAALAQPRVAVPQ